MQFTKLFNSILDSTIWQEPAETKIAWITLLAMADRHGDVFASVPGLASRAKITLPQCESAISCFLSPDPYSRTKDHDGRRLAEIDGGWRLLNHGKYRALLSAEERKEYNRKKQQEYREKKRLGVNDPSTDVNDESMTINDSQSLSAECTHTEAEAEAEADTKKKKKAVPAPVDLPFDSDQFKAAWETWLAHNKAKGKKMPYTTITLQLSKLRKWGETNAIRSIETSIENNWQGLFEPKEESPALFSQTQKKRGLTSADVGI